MNPHVRKLLPSGSMVVAVIALLVAMSGSAVAASLITGEQIKDGTIQTKDLSKKTRTKLAGASAGARGPAGPAGPKGDRGADGSDGAAGAVVRRGQSEVGAHQSGIALAHCHPGEEAIGGGGEFAAVDRGSDLVPTGGDAAWIDRTAPAAGAEAASEGGTADGWLARGFNDGDAPQTITAFAVCVPTDGD